jgi:hypothetical protein
MIDLLLIEHGEKPVGPLRSGAAKYPKVISHGVAVYVPKLNLYGTTVFAPTLTNLAGCGVKGFKRKKPSGFVPRAILKP